MHFSGIKSSLCPSSELQLTRHRILFKLVQPWKHGNTPTDKQSGFHIYNIGTEVVIREDKYVIFHPCT